MAQLKLEIITPEKVAFTQDVNSVTIPGSEGELGILPNHVPLMTKIKPGEIKAVVGGKTEYLAVGEGFAEVTGSRVLILADMAIEHAEIDEQAAEAAMERARKALQEVPAGSEEAGRLMATIQKSAVQVGLKRRLR